MAALSHAVVLAPSSSSSFSSTAALPKRSLWSTLSISWLTPLFKKGHAAPLTEEALPDLPDFERHAASEHALDAYWADCRPYWDAADPVAEPVAAGSKAASPPNLRRVLLKYGRVYYVCAALCQAVSVVTAILQPLMIPLILALLIPGSTAKHVLGSNLYAMAAMLFVLQLISALAAYTFQSLTISLGVKLNSILVSAIYEKSLRIAPQSAEKFSAGKINTLIGADTTAIAQAPVYAISLVALIVQLLVAIGLLLNYLRAAAVPALVFYGFLIMVEIKVMPRIATGIRAYCKAQDQRSKVLREFLYGIKYIKFQAIEELWRVKIDRFRNEQIAANHSIMRVFGTFYASSSTRQYMIPTLSILVYAAINKSVEPATIFTALALLDAIAQPSGTMNSTIGQLLKVPVSYERVTSFLLTPEIDATQVTAVHSVGPKQDKSIVLSSASFAYDHAPKKQKSSPAAGDKPSDASTPFQLENLNLNISRGTLVAVVGKVASGKSSLISALVGSMRKSEGKALMFGSVAYCPQEPWILSGSVRDNILFGDASVESRIPAAVDAACLQHDLDIMPHGVETLIGEKGVNMSGGQRARVALARAIARDADIYLLDDPCASLDAHVAKRVFESTILGVLAKKTVVMVTHQLHTLSRCDLIVVMEAGRIRESGSYAELMGTEGSALREMLEHYSHEEQPQEEVVDVTVDSAQDEIIFEALKKYDVQQAVAEDRRTGAFSAATVMSYFRAGGPLYLVGVLAILTALVGVTAFTKIFLALWAKDYFNLATGGYIKIYTVLGVINTLIVYSLISFVLYSGMRACIAIHSRAMDGVQRATMMFFEGPAGRVLNRLTIDVREMDGNLPINIFITSREFCYFMSAVVIVAYATPYMLLVFVVIVAGALYFYRLFRPTYRELKRLVSVLLSPVLMHTSETLNGVASIRAYGAERHFIAAQSAKLDRSNAASLYFQSGKAWLGLRLDLLTSFIVLVLVLLAARGVVDGVQVGLGLTASFSLGTWFNSFLQAYTSTETMFNGIERLNHYSYELPAEPARKMPADPEPEAWPTVGAISIENLSLRYPNREDHAVIKDLSVSIRGGEKIAIVGRTGSGKSSVLSAIFRVLEPWKGTIKVDGKDITQLGLKTLRSSLGIVAQEAILFAGTLRSNIDVAGTHSDDAVWNALDAVGLHTLASDDAAKLERPVTESGANLSAGTRQLLCLARAVLESRRVLLLDEATAFLDHTASGTVHDLLRGPALADTTVIAVMHSLTQIARFDRVLLFEDGVLKECDSPAALLRDETTAFGLLLAATGEANAAKVHKEVLGLARTDSDLTLE
ncbi:hypothetical protein HDU90_000977 [Geranomyces variabilis]|nr:hypothetical protein HDU90_000977 [Geranomyces variabilis]